MDINKNQPTFQITTNLNHLRNQSTEYAKYDNQGRTVPLTVVPTSTQVGSGQKIKKKKSVRKVKKVKKVKKMKGGTKPDIRHSFNYRREEEDIDSNFNNIMKKQELLKELVKYEVNLDYYLLVVQLRLFNFIRVLDNYQTRFRNDINTSNIRTPFQQLLDTARRLHEEFKRMQIRIDTEQRFTPAYIRTPQQINTLYISQVTNFIRLMNNQITDCLRNLFTALDQLAKVNINKKNRLLQ
jgi:hypothetical protein